MNVHPMQIHSGSMKMKLITACALAAAVWMSPVSGASAGLIQIQLGGIDLRLNGTNIVDAGTADPDPLTNATFLDDGVVLGVDDTDVTLDLRIPGVSNIPVGGGQVNSAANGDLDLDLGGGDFLSLTLDSATVNYIPLTSTIQFVFIGIASSIDGQQLPFGVSLVDPVSVTFSTQVTEAISQSGGFVTVFVSAGTGEIQGVPEPATMGLLTLGFLGVAALRRRKK